MDSSKANSSESKDIIKKNVKAKSKNTLRNSGKDQSTSKTANKSPSSPNNHRGNIPTTTTTTTTTTNTNDETNNTNNPASPSTKHPVNCRACDKQIHDYYLLSIGADRHFHEDCLSCVECGGNLEKNKTCFVKEGRLFCKKDYERLQKVKCGLCGCRFHDDEMVISTCKLIYHVDCFRCVVCSRVISKGELYSTINDKLYCKMDYESEVAATDHQSDTSSYNNDDSGDFEAFDSKSLNGDQTNNDIPLASQQRDCRQHQLLNSKGSASTLACSTKTTRIRTVLNEKQLHTLRTCYAANPRPDALMKEQLVEMTGLNPRVIRVWFQNKRCKDKKRSLLIRQIRQQQEKRPHSQEGVSDPVEMWLTNKGVPMIASSPVCHPSGTPLLTAIEIQPHPATAWKVDYNNQQQYHASDNCDSNNNTQHSEKSDVSADVRNNSSSNNSNHNNDNDNDDNYLKGKNMNNKLNDSLEALRTSNNNNNIIHPSNEAFQLLQQQLSNNLLFHNKNYNLPKKVLLPFGNNYHNGFDNSASIFD